MFSTGFFCKSLYSFLKRVLHRDILWRLRNEQQRLTPGGPYKQLAGDVVVTVRCRRGRIFEQVK
jgi:hypothetical protein